MHPTYAIFVKIIPTPTSEMDDHFATFQEAARKDVEHDFWVLQQRFTVVRYPTLT
jgi:hypothetical protein